MVRGADGYEAQAARLAVQQDPGLLDRAASFAWSVLGYGSPATTAPDKPPVPEAADVAPDAHGATNKGTEAGGADAGRVPEGGDAPAERIPAPTADAIAAEAKSQAASGEGDPLAKAIGVIGKVRYKDEKHLPGSGEFTRAERSALLRGDADIQFANCSTFTTWALAAAGVDIYAKGEGADGRLVDYLNINAGLSTGTLSGDIAADSDNIKGAASAFVTSGVGVEVDKSAVKPGDFIQTWTSRGGGHSTMARRIHVRGSAVFGLPGSPTLEGDAPAAPGTAMGVEAPVDFILDENTLPSLVGRHEVISVEKLGANLAGTGADGQRHEAGVYTSAASNLAHYHKAYIGRLNSSRWLAWFPIDVSAHVQDGPGATDPGQAAQRSDASEEDGGAAAAVTRWTRDTAAAGVGKARGVMHSVSEFLSGEGEQTAAADPAAAPSEPQAARATFQAPGVRGCDYTVDPQGTIHYFKDGALKRSFAPDHALYQQIKAEILARYPDAPL